MLKLNMLMKLKVVVKMNYKVLKLFNGNMNLQRPLIKKKV